MIRVGTSGYNYPEWKGPFYPPTLASGRMLEFYAERFLTVEINYTFYRMPTEKTVAAWAAATPPSFAFALKAPRRITHLARLRDCAEPTARFCAVAGVLGDKLGPLLFQLPPNFKCDAGLLEAFLDGLPPGTRAAFEFRHPSWFSADVLASLRRRNLALCVADSERLTTPVELTADYAYFRLRDEGYHRLDLAGWAKTVAAAHERCAEVCVYFKHEESGSGPAFARTLLELLGLAQPEPGPPAGMPAATSPRAGGPEPRPRATRPRRRA